MFDPDDKVSGGQGFIYASSIIVAMRKKKLKEDEAGAKVADVRGIKASCKVMKSRYSKPFEVVDVYIPYEQGMDPYSGLFDLFLKSGILEKSGNRYKYESKVAGADFIEFRKYLTSDHYELIMNEVVNDGIEIELQDISEDDEEEDDGN